MPRFLLASIALLATATALPALEFHADLYGGVLQGSDETKPNDQRPEVGVLTDLRLPFMPFSVAANGFYNQKSGDVDNGSGGTTEQTVTAKELQLGIVKIWDPAIIVHPFIGGGVTWVDATVETSQGSEDGRAVGGWVYGGTHIKLALFDVGALVGWSSAKIDTGSASIDMGGLRYGAFAGIGF